VKRLIVKGEVAVDARDEFGNTALMNAAEAGNVALASFLIKQGADVNAVNKDGWSSLHCAVDANHLEVIKLLTTEGATVNLKRIVDGETPVFLAAYLGHIDIVKHLIGKGADQNIQSNTKETAVDAALADGQIEVLNFLLLHGADLWKCLPKNHQKLSESLERAKWSKKDKNFSPLVAHGKSSSVTIDPSNADDIGSLIKAAERESKKNILGKDKSRTPRSDRSPRPKDRSPRISNKDLSQNLFKGDPVVAAQDVIAKDDSGSTLVAAPITSSPLARIPSTLSVPTLPLLDKLTLIVKHGTKVKKVIINAKLEFDAVRDELKTRFEISKDVELQLYDEAAQTLLSVDNEQDWKDALVDVGAMLKVTLV
jgi:hypothetical protein